MSALQMMRTVSKPGPRLKATECSLRNKSRIINTARLDRSFGTSDLADSRLVLSCGADATKR
jgi:hypothetical protein